MFQWDTITVRTFWPFLSSHCIRHGLSVQIYICCSHWSCQWASSQLNKDLRVWVSRACKGNGCRPVRPVSFLPLSFFLYLFVTWRKKTTTIKFLIFRLNFMRKTDAAMAKRIWLDNPIRIYVPAAKWNDSYHFVHMQMCVCEWWHLQRTSKLWGQWVVVQTLWDWTTVPFISTCMTPSSSTSVCSTALAVQSALSLT